MGNFAIGFGVAALTIIVVIRILSGVDTSLITTENRNVVNQSKTASDGSGQDLGDMGNGIVTFNATNTTSGVIIQNGAARNLNYTINYTSGQLTFFSNSTYVNQTVKLIYTYNINVGSGETNATQDAIQGVAQISDYFTIIGIVLAAIIVVFFLNRVFGPGAS